MEFTCKLFLSVHLKLQAADYRVVLMSILDLYHDDVGSLPSVMQLNFQNCLVWSGVKHLWLVKLSFSMGFKLETA